MSKKSKHHKPKGPKNPPQDQPAQQPQPKIEEIPETAQIPPSEIAPLPETKPDPVPIAEQEQKEIIQPQQQTSAETPIKPKRNRGKRNKKHPQESGNAENVEEDQQKDEGAEEKKEEVSVQSVEIKQEQIEDKQIIDDKPAEKNTKHGKKEKGHPKDIKTAPEPAKIEIKDPEIITEQAPVTQLKVEEETKQSSDAENVESKGKGKKSRNKNKNKDNKETQSCPILQGQSSEEIKKSEELKEIDKCEIKPEVPKKVEIEEQKIICEIKPEESPKQEECKIAEKSEVCEVKSKDHKKKSKSKAKDQQACEIKSAGEVPKDSQIIDEDKKTIIEKPDNEVVCEIKTKDQQVCELKPSAEKISDQSCEEKKESEKITESTTEKPQDHQVCELKSLIEDTKPVSEELIDHRTCEVKMATEKIIDQSTDISTQDKLFSKNETPTDAEKAIETIKVEEVAHKSEGDRKGKKGRKGHKSESHDEPKHGKPVTEKQPNIEDVAVCPVLAEPKPTFEEKRENPEDDILPSLASSIEKTLEELIVCESDIVLGEQLKLQEENNKKSEASKSIEIVSEDKKDKEPVVSKEPVAKIEHLVVEEAADSGRSPTRKDKRKKSPRPRKADEKKEEKTKSSEVPKQIETIAGTEILSNVCEIRAKEEIVSQKKDVKQMGSVTDDIIEALLSDTPPPFVPDKKDESAKMPSNDDDTKQTCPMKLPSAITLQPEPRETKETSPQSDMHSALLDVCHIESNIEKEMKKALDIALGVVVGNMSECEPEPRKQEEQPLPPKLEEQPFPLKQEEQPVPLTQNVEEKPEIVKKPDELKHKKKSKKHDKQKGEQPLEKEQDTSKTDDSQKCEIPPKTEEQIKEQPDKVESEEKGKQSEDKGEDPIETKKEKKNLDTCKPKEEKKDDRDDSPKPPRKQKDKKGRHGKGGGDNTGKTSQGGSEQPQQGQESGKSQGGTKEEDSHEQIEDQTEDSKQFEVLLNIDENEPKSGPEVKDTYEPKIKPSPKTPSKNLYGPSNTPVKSSKYDYKKEKNKDPEQTDNEVQNLPETSKAYDSKDTESKDDPEKRRVVEYDVKYDDEEDDGEEFVYKYSFRTVFIANACHVCKVQLKDVRVVCRFCHLVSYCTDKHRDDNWMEHQYLCYAVSTLANSKGFTHIYEDAKCLTGHDYRLLRMQAIVACEKLLKRKLCPWEQETLLYPRICSLPSCRQWNSNLLKDCDGCGQISYCAADPNHLPAEHANWCSSYKLYHKLVVHQLNHGRLEPQLPCKIPPTGYKLPDKSSLLYDDLYGTVANMDDCHFATLTQLATVPLTTLYAYQKAMSQKTSDHEGRPNGVIEANINGVIKSEKTNFCVHLIGAELQFEGDTLKKWESFFLHLMPQLKELKVVFIGPELNAAKLPVELLSKIKLCQYCRETERKIKFDFIDSILYHDYVESERFTKPDIICAFNPGFHRATGYAGLDTWPETIACALRMHVPLCVSAYTAHEMPRDLDRVRRCAPTGGPPPRLLVAPAMNPYSSLRPDRNFVSDDEMPLIFKNYHAMVVAG